MKKYTPQLFEILQHLTPAEWRSLRKLLRSDYLTKRNEIKRLFAELDRCIQRDKPFPDRENLFKAVFPRKPFEDLRLRACMSDLQGMVEDHLFWNHTREKRVDQELFFTRYYRSRNLFKHYRKHSRKAAKLIRQEPFQGPEYFAHLLHFEEEKLLYLTATKRAEELNLQQISDTIDLQYLVLKLRNACTQLSHQQVYKTKYDWGLLPHIIQEVNQEKYLSVPAIAVYYHCYRFLAEAYDPNHFQEFQELLLQHRKHFPREEMKDLYLVAINFCIRKLNEGDAVFAPSGLGLYEQALEEGVLLENGRLSRFTFNNVIGFALRLQKAGEAERYIREYQKHLDPNFRESTVKFNQARVEFLRGNYQEVLFLLQTTSFKDLVNNLITKTMLLKIYYETGELDLLDAQLDSFTSYIRRRELSDYHQTNYRNIIHFTRRMANLIQEDHTQRDKLVQEIENTPVLSEKKWMLEQLT